MPDTVFTANASRRTILRGSAMLGAGAAASGLLPGVLLAQDGAALWPGVTRLVRSYVDARKVANMVAALGWGQDEPTFIAAGTNTFGGATQSGPDTLYRVYSMTKPVTGMAAMMLIDAGRLGLDQPLAEILPAFANMQVQKRADGPITADNLEPAVRPITIRHLLTHTAGFGYSIIQQGPLRQAYIARGLVPGRISRIALAQQIYGGTPAASLAAFADGLAQVPLVYQPGTNWSYSVGLDLLGRVIEVVSGQPFDAFLKERIFDPIGMTSTMFQVPQSEISRFTGNYFILAGIPIPIDLPGSSIFLEKPEFPFGGAGLVSTARDYDRFLQMLAGLGEIDGRRVMSEAAVRLGASDLLPDTLAANGAFRAGFGYGAGGLVGKGETQGLYGWFGAAGTSGLVNLNWGLRLSLMTQYMPQDAYPLQEEFPLTVAADAARILQSR